MYPTITYREEHGKLSITIKPNHKFIIKFGFLFQGFFYIAIGIAIGYFILSDKNAPGFAYIFVLLFCSSLMYFSWYYLKKVYYKEIIIVDPHELKLEKIRLGKKNSKTFKVSEISHLSYVGREDFSRHDLANENYVTGLGVGESEIQYINEEGTISFFYNGMTIRFGIQVDSEDGEEIIQRLTAFTKNDLSTDDGLENIFKPKEY